MTVQEAANEAAEATASRAEIAAESPHAKAPGRLKAWFFEEGPWWLCSFVFHLLLVCSLALIGGKAIEKIVDNAPSFEGADVRQVGEVLQNIERFEIGETPVEPSALNTETLSLENPGLLAPEVQAEKSHDAGTASSDSSGGGIAAATNQPNLGGVGGFDLKNLGPGPAIKGKGGVGIGVGSGLHPGSGGDGWGFAGRGVGSRKALLASGGGTQQSERAVGGALNWLARHQSLDGGWSLTSYKVRCKDASCTGGAKVGGYESAATALGLLPFLGAGQTHESKSRYKQNIKASVFYLINHQDRNGDLRMGTTMYAHGLASLALCECYGMSGDKQVGRAAQAALNFIMEAQDPVGGGWRYDPREPGDISVTGWQIMALKSGQMARLNVNPAVLEKAKVFLKSVASAEYVGRFTYMPDRQLVDTDDRAVTAVGLLCKQYLRVPRTDSAMMAGTSFLMENQPDPSGRNLYYWYYATQAMHNQPGPSWDVWNRKMRRLLIETQNKEGDCAVGSWDPNAPQPDKWGGHGGRLMVTSLAALTLEVYYRYLPLYKLDKEYGAESAPAEQTSGE